MLLTADWHLDDKPGNEYRWRVFDDVRRWIREKVLRGTAAYVVIAGDLGDRKDRHNAKFVTRLVERLEDLVAAGGEIIITRGNHDTPINGPAFWSFLSAIPGVTFVAEPFLV